MKSTYILLVLALCAFITPVTRADEASENSYTPSQPVPEVVDGSNPLEWKADISAFTITSVEELSKVRSAAQRKYSNRLKAMNNMQNKFIRESPVENKKKEYEAYKTLKRLDPASAIYWVETMTFEGLVPSDELTVPTTPAFEAFKHELEDIRKMSGFRSSRIFELYNLGLSRASSIREEEQYLAFEAYKDAMRAQGKEPDFSLEREE